MRPYVSMAILNHIWASLADNKLLIVKLGGLEPLIRQMLSPNVEVQCNAVGCVTNLATHGLCFLSPRVSVLIVGTSDDNKTKIAKSGALVPLTRLARSKDMRVQRNATGALLNMTHSGEDTQVSDMRSWLICGYLKMRTDNSSSTLVQSQFL